MEKAEHPIRTAEGRRENVAGVTLEYARPVRERRWLPVVFAVARALLVAVMALLVAGVGAVWTTGGTEGAISSFEEDVWPTVWLAGIWVVCLWAFRGMDPRKLVSRVG